MTHDDIRTQILALQYACDDGEQLAQHLGDALKGVLDIHPPHKIYDECEHEHAYDDPALIDTGDFTTCQDGYMYDICTACCTAGWDNDQTEECANDHSHGKDEPICPTVGAITAALGTEEEPGD